MTFHDKYAAFVWPAYGISAVAFVWMILDTVLRSRAWRRRAEPRDPPPGRAP